MQNTKHICTATEIKVSANYVWKPLRTLTSFSNYTKREKTTPSEHLLGFLCSIYLEEGMATPSSILAWKIPWIEEPGEL